MTKKAASSQDAAQWRGDSGRLVCWCGSWSWCFRLRGRFCCFMFLVVLLVVLLLACCFFHFRLSRSSLGSRSSRSFSCSRFSSKGNTSKSNCYERSNNGGQNFFHFFRTSECYYLLDKIISITYAKHTKEHNYLSIYTLHNTSCIFKSTRIP